MPVDERVGDCCLSDGGRRLLVKLFSLFSLSSLSSHRQRNRRLLYQLSPTPFLHPRQLQQCTKCNVVVVLERSVMCSRRCSSRRLIYAATSLSLSPHAETTTLMPLMQRAKRRGSGGLDRAKRTHAHGCGNNRNNNKENASPEAATRTTATAAVLVVVVVEAAGGFVLLPVQQEVHPRNFILLSALCSLLYLADGSPKTKLLMHLSPLPLPSTAPLLSLSFPDSHPADQWCNLSARKKGSLLLLSKRQDSGMNLFLALGSLRDCTVHPDFASLLPKTVPALIFDSQSPAPSPRLQTISWKGLLLLFPCPSSVLHPSIASDCHTERSSLAPAIGHKHRVKGAADLKRNMSLSLSPFIHSRDPYFQAET